MAFDRAGKAVWQRSLTEEFGFYSGFGGRTHTPMIDEGRLVLSFTNAGWGEQAPACGHLRALFLRPTPAQPRPPWAAPCSCWVMADARDHATALGALAPLLA